MGNKRYTIDATVITPLSIGCGEEKNWVQGIDYLTKNGVLYHLNISKLIESRLIDVNRLSALYASGRANEIENIIGNRLEAVSDFQMNLPTTTNNPIKVFYKNALTGKPVLCGSSIKGSIRSALLHKFYSSASQAKGITVQSNNDLNNHFFGPMKEGKDFMRFIEIGDIDFDKTGLVNTKIYNLHTNNNDNNWEGGWKFSNNETRYDFSQNGFNTIYECLLPGAHSQGNLVILSSLFERMEITCKEQKEIMDTAHKEQKEIMLAEKPNEVLCEKINDATFEYLDKEAVFFKHYNQGDYASYIDKELTRLMDTIDNMGSDECLIKMSAGVGFHSITGDWQYDDFTKTGKYEYGKHKDKLKYKSRKIACYKERFLPMGMIKLKIHPENT